MATTRRTHVARALHAARPDAVSGEALAASLGISRVAVGKHIAALEAAGFSIERVVGVGYRLLGVPDRCVPEAVAAHVEDPFWTRFEGAETLGSTNDECARLAREGAPEGTVVCAARQTTGKGRLGRSWSSPEGGVYLSVLLRPALALPDVPALPLAVALGVARGLASLGVETGLKWPNDLQRDGRKLGGVLLEMAAESDAVAWVVAGVGVNVAPVAEPGAAWVHEAAPATVPEVAAALLEDIAGTYREVTRGGFAAIAAEYRERSVLLGHAVEVRDINGRMVAAGYAEDVDARGALVVRTADGLRAVSAGDVTLRGEEGS